MKRTTAILFALLLLTSALTFPCEAKTTIPKGAYGVWECSSIKTTSILYKGNISTKADQKIVDRENSACWRTYGKGHGIYDHAGSAAGKGVWSVEDMRCGGIATLTTAKTKTYYQCTAIYLAKQTKYVMKYDGETLACKKDDVICVSCAEDDGMVYVAYYKKIA